MTGLILASSSAARQAMLAAAGIAVDLRGHGIDEPALMQELANTRATPRKLAAALAEAKAINVSRGEPGMLVIGADQTLDLAGETLGKPANLREAATQLARLAGRRHSLHSAFAVASGGRVVARQVRSARLTMRQLGQDEIDGYLDAVGPTALTSVGAYQVEGRGIRLFESIEGDFFTILGLPLLPLLKVLRRLGAIA